MNEQECFYELGNRELLAPVSTLFLPPSPAIFDVCYGTVQGILFSPQVQVSDRRPPASCLSAPEHQSQECLDKIGTTQETVWE